MRNQFLEEVALEEQTNTDELTFQDGIDVATEQYALETLMDDFDTFSNVLEKAKPDMDDLALEGLAIALNTDSKTIVAIAALEEDSKFKKLKDGLIKIAKTILKWVKTGFQKLKAKLFGSSEETIKQIKAQDKQTFMDNKEVNDLEKEVEKEPENNKSEMKLIQLVRAGRIASGQFGLFGKGAYIIGRDDVSITTKDKETNEVTVIPIKYDESVDLSEYNVDLLDQFLSQATKNIADSEQRLVKTSELMAKADDIRQENATQMKAELKQIQSELNDDITELKILSKVLTDIMKGREAQIKLAK